MRGITFIAAGQAAFTEEADPACPSDGVLLQTLYSGLSNGTERNKLTGGNYHRGSWPDRIGYQHVSRVLEAGPETKEFAVGDLVFTGNFPGHVPLHACRESDLIVKIPAASPHWALTAVAAVPYHNARRAKVTPADRVLIFGDGLIGHFAGQVCLALGAHVTLAGHHEDRLEAARRAGMDVVIDNRREAGRRAVAEGGPYDVVFECSGGDVLPEILGPGWSRTGLLARHGRILMIAGRREVRYDFNAASSYEAVFYSSAHFTRPELHELAGLVRRGRIDLSIPLREIVPIAKALAVYDRLRDQPSSLFGTVFDWGVVGAAGGPGD